MDLNEIISGDAPELTKIASIAGAFVSGEISAEDGNDLALAANIHPDRVKNFVIEHQDDLEKEASAGELTYLEKVAHIVDDVYAGEISGYDLEEIAYNNGIAMKDIDAIAGIAYGDEELSKEAQLYNAEEILADEDVSYIQKTASIASLVANEVISEEEAYNAALNFGIGEDDLEFELSKNAGIRSFFTGKKKDKIVPRDAVSSKAAVYGPSLPPRERTLIQRAQKKAEIYAKKGTRGAKRAAKKGTQWVKDNKGKAALGAAGATAVGTGGTYYATRD